MISVIMPVYNTEEYLEESVDSVLTQSHQHLELIIVNDNSTDQSRRLIERLKNRDIRIKAYHFSENVGVGAARNYGLKKAIGKYIYFIDSDDYLANKTLSLLIQKIKDYNLIVGSVKDTNISGQNNLHTESGTGHKLFSASDKFKIVKDFSVLNILFKKHYISSNNLRFTTSIPRFTELNFIIPAVINAHSIPMLESAIYYKRKRNDPISNPSLMQTDILYLVNDLTYIYNKIYISYGDNKHINQILDSYFIAIYENSIVNYFKINSNIKKVFDQLVTISRRVNGNFLKQQPYLIRKEIRMLQKGNMKKFKKVNIRHSRYRKLGRLRGKRTLLIQLYKTLFLKLPLQRKTVVFESFLGKSYSDNPKYIYEYMLKNKKDYKYIWIMNQKTVIPGDPKQVKRFSLFYFYYLARAKYWVSNSRLPRTLNKREGNIYLQTWHGTPLKKLVFDMRDIHSADPGYKTNFYKQSRRWDYLSSPNAYSTGIFRSAFKYEKKVLEFGYPRNDILYQKNNKEDIIKLKKKMGIPRDKKVILYAPTWRDDEFYERGKYKFSLQVDLGRLQKEIGNEYIIILRMHYFIASQLDISAHQGFAYDFSNYNDIAELYLISDILITDYSSVFFDYANLKRPILFYMYDLEKYQKKLRGFYIDIENEIPGPILRNNDELISTIQNIEEVQEEYSDKYHDFHNRFCSWDDGNATKKTVEEVFVE